MNMRHWLLLAAATVRTGLPANLIISTYLKDGFTPSAIASDLQGNIYLAGSAVIDAASQATGAVVAKLDPKATQYLYLAYLDSAASDQVMTLLRNLADERRQTILMVTHNASHAAMADRLLRLTDGRIVEQQTLPHRRSFGKVLEDLEAW